MSARAAGVPREAERYTKIAVVRANGIGDLMFSLPALEALRARFPQAEIVLLATCLHKRLLQGRPGPVDRVVVIPPCPGVGEDPATPVDETALAPFFAAMQGERFDLAIQLHGGGRYSNPFVRRLGAGLAIGLRAPDAEPLDRWVPYIYFHHEVMRYLEVVSLVGAEPVRLAPRLAVTEADRAESYAVLPADDRAAGARGSRPLAVLHAGASDPRRWWPAEHMAAVGDALAAAGARVAVIGTEAERRPVDAVLRAMTRSPEDLCGRLTLNGLVGVLSRAAVVVSNDSGPLHLAGAVGAGTVGVYWCGNYFNGAPFTRRRHRAAISWRLDCPVCGRNTFHDPCQHRESFVADVPVGEVMSSALDLLAAHRPGCARA